MFYISLTVNIKEKLVEDTQNIKREKSKHTTAEKSSDHQKDSKRGRKKQRNYRTVKRQLIK